MSEMLDPSTTAFLNALRSNEKGPGNFARAFFFSMRGEPSAHMHWPDVVLHVPVWQPVIVQSG